MNTLIDFKFSISKDFVGIEAQTSAESYKRIYFLWTIDEFESFTFKGGAFADIAHRADTFGGDGPVTFYDFNILREPSGTMQVPYITVNIPHFVRKMVLKLAKQAVKSNIENKIYLNVSKQKLERWVRMYGCGKGKAKFLLDPTTEVFLDECREKGGNFQEQLDRLEAIAQNQTYSVYQTGKVRLSKDWDGFYFSFYAPRCERPNMVGGLVNHQRDESKETMWSLHT